MTEAATIDRLDDMLDGEKRLMSAMDAGVKYLGYPTANAVRQSIYVGSFPVPLYKREQSKSSRWLVFSTDVADYLDNLTPVKSA